MMKFVRDGQRMVCVAMIFLMCGCSSTINVIRPTNNESSQDPVRVVFRIDPEVDVASFRAYLKFKYHGDVYNVTDLRPLMQTPIEAGRAYDISVPLSVNIDTVADADAKRNLEDCQRQTLGQCSDSRLWMIELRAEFRGNRSGFSDLNQVIRLNRDIRISQSCWAC